MGTKRWIWSYVIVLAVLLAVALVIGVRVWRAQ